MHIAQGHHWRFPRYEGAHLQSPWKDNHSFEDNLDSTGRP